MKALVLLLVSLGLSCDPAFAQPSAAPSFAPPNPIVETPEGDDPLPGDPDFEAHVAPSAPSAAPIPSEPASAGQGAPAVASAPLSAPSGEEIYEQGRQAGEKVAAAVKSKSIAGWLLAISSCLFLVVLLARRWGGLFLQGNSVRMLTVIAGGVAAAVAYVADNPTPSDLLLYFLAGPGAIAINETIKLFGRPSKPKAAGG